MIDEKYNGYKCFDLLKRLLQNDKDFTKKVSEGMSLGKITVFDENIFEKIRNQNIRRINSFEDVFKEGCNIDYCTPCARQLSFSYDGCYLCGGVVDAVRTEKNKDGSHTWISHNNRVIDTTLMLVIDEEYSKVLGYIEENRYDPTIDSIYNASKEFAMDSDLKKSR